jgi:hypothetical protein
MTGFLPLAIRITRAPGADAPGRRFRIESIRRLLAPLAVAVALAGLTAVPAMAAATGSTSIGILVNAVRSITVSPASVALINCAGGTSDSTHLGFPSGVCGVNPGITVTNGGVAGHVSVTGADAVPVDNGQHWVLCGGAGGPACTGPTGSPGQDQYLERVGTSTVGGPVLTNVALCDTSFGAAAPATPSCAAAANQSVGEGIYFAGPTVTTDPSASFTTMVTWTATP